MTDLVELRPVQLASVLKALVGAEEMQRKMIEAIGMEKTIGVEQMGCFANRRPVPPS